MVNSNRMRKNAKRPKSVTLLAVFVLIVALINLIRIIQVLKQWQFISAVLSYAPYYQVISGIAGFLCCLALFVCIWQGRRNTLVFILLGGVVYSIYYWIDRFAISSTPFGSNWLFILIVNGLFLLFMAWSLTRKNTQTFFGVAYDTESQDR